MCNVCVKTGVKRAAFFFTIKINYNYRTSYVARIQRAKTPCSCIDRRGAAAIFFLGMPILWIPLYCIFLGRRCYRVSTSRGQVQDGGDADGQVQAGAGQRLGGQMLR